MSNYYLGQIRNAKAETERLINKELAYQPKFQKLEYLAELRAHIEKLDRMAIEIAASNNWAPNLTNNGERWMNS